MQNLQKQARKGMLNLAQMQHHNQHVKRETYGLFRFCFHFSKAALPLSETELPLNINPLVLVEIGACHAAHPSLAYQMPDR